MKQLSHYEDEVVARVREISAKSLSRLEGTQSLLLGRVPFHQAISDTVREGRELHPLPPNTVKSVRKDRENIWSRRKGSDRGISPQLTD